MFVTVRPDIVTIYLKSLLTTKTKLKYRVFKYFKSKNYSRIKFLKLALKSCLNLKLINIRNCKKQI